ncbi:hypothetical protein Pth03_82570 [Planotetraspora thailandica]|uniref:Uncharacterized protein n=1 Tax=Planotetraspora thailandica TaxID=487172 RepID=A0A8J3Y2S2_9ACTN|nr:hypothetical protein [Planotetraspora thailandica]GII59868.1 hypothetical protein Pth03_82570 [Planotetraspora thailandica]
MAINNTVQAIAWRAGIDVANTVTAHGLRAGVPTDLGAQGYSAAEIKDMTGGHWSSTDMVEKYRKTGRRRAGKRSDESRSSGALSMLRVEQTIPPTNPEG